MDEGLFELEQQS